MLVVNRTRKASSIIIGDGPRKITITVIEWRDSGVRIGIEAPPDVPVHRKEIYDVIKMAGGDLLSRKPSQGENLASGGSSG